MNPKLRRILKAAVYPLSYSFMLAIFLVWTFPYDRLKERLVAEFNAKQPAGAGTRLEIEKMSGYWFSGIEAQGVKFVSPPPPPDEDGKVKEAHVTTLDDVHVRIALLRYLFGTKYITFGGEAFGGKLSGHTSDADEARSIAIELENVNVNDMPLLRDVVGLPLEGKLSGKIDLKLPESKLAKAEGKIELKITDLAIGDGKAKIRDALALPKIEAGELVLEAEASEGRLKIDKFTANGKDLELASEGSIRLRDPFETSLAELTLRFKFSDAYKHKNDMTKGLFDPGPNIPGAFDLDPKNQRAKRPDGFYAFRLTGPLQKLETQPAPLGGPGAAGPARGARGFTPTR